MEDVALCSIALHLTPSHLYHNTLVTLLINRPTKLSVDFINKNVHKGNSHRYRLLSRASSIPTVIPGFITTTSARVRTMSSYGVQAIPLALGFLSWGGVATIESTSVCILL
jgi:hypothetical protein